MDYQKKSFKSRPYTKADGWPKCGKCEEAEYEEGKRTDCVLDMGHKGDCLFPKMPR